MTEARKYLGAAAAALTTTTLLTALTALLTLDSAIAASLG